MSTKWFVERSHGFRSEMRGLWSQVGPSSFELKGSWLSTLSKYAYSLTRQRKSILFSVHVAPSLFDDRQKPIAGRKQDPTKRSSSIRGAPGTTQISNPSLGAPETNTVTVAALCSRKSGQSHLPLPRKINDHNGARPRRRIMDILCSLNWTLDGKKFWKCGW
jgi:hypothetical protein